MKITAEFNSTEELLSFIGTFGTKAAIQLEGAKVGSKSEEKKVAPEKKEQVKVQPKKGETKDNIPVVETEQLGQADEVTDVKEAEETEDVKVTKEEVRAIFSKIIKAGKAKEAKELTTKYGASKISEVKEEDYAAILKDAEGLL